MYTAELFDRTKEGVKNIWTVIYTNGSDSFSEKLEGGDYESLRRRVASRLVELNKPDPFSYGPIDSNIAPEVEDTATLQRKAWIQSWTYLQKANQLIQAGIITDTLPAYITLKQDVISGFKPGYLAHIA